MEGVLLIAMGKELFTDAQELPVNRISGPCREDEEFLDNDLHGLFSSQILIDHATARLCGRSDEIRRELSRTGEMWEHDKIWLEEVSGEKIVQSRL